MALSPWHTWCKLILPYGATSGFLPHFLLSSALVRLLHALRPAGVTTPSDSCSKSEASLHSLSASSLPLMPLCPLTQTTRVSMSYLLSSSVLQSRSVAGRIPDLAFSQLSISSSSGSWIRLKNSSTRPHSFCKDRTPRHMIHPMSHTWVTDLTACLGSYISLVAHLLC